MRIIIFYTYSVIRIKNDDFGYLKSLSEETIMKEKWIWFVRWIVDGMYVGYVVVYDEVLNIAKRGINGDIWYIWSLNCCEKQ